VTTRDFDAREFLARCRVLQAQVASAAPAALVDAGEQVLGDAQQLCPVRTGTLMGSATLDDSRAARGEVTIGFNTTYAAAVHERMDVRHGQGQAKFLATAMANDLPRINAVLGRRIGREGLR